VTGIFQQATGGGIMVALSTVLMRLLLWGASYASKIAVNISPLCMQPEASDQMVG